MEAPARAGGKAAFALKRELRIISKVEFNPAIFHLEDLAKCLQFNSRNFSERCPQAVRE